MLSGLVICFSWYFTIISGFYILYCPVMYLMFINRLWFRKVVDFLFCLWEMYPVALFQWCYGTKLHCFGDFVEPDETNIIFMNHRTRVDWNYVWIALYHAAQNAENTDCEKKSVNELMSSLCSGKSKLKLVLKDEIKTVPGLGWIMQLNYFLYVKRNWIEDQVSLTEFVDYYRKLKYNIRIVLFPEGTDLSRDNLAKSERFSIANNLPAYNHLLQPRTTGFAVLCNQLRNAGLASVYDVTIAYDKPPQTEMDLLKGNLPHNVYFHFKRYVKTELPTDEDDLRTWLKDRWTDKEASLHNFRSKGTFMDVSGQTPVKLPARSLKVAQAVFLFWILLDLSFMYLIANSSVFQFWTIYHTLLFTFVTWYFGGFHKIQHKLAED